MLPDSNWFVSREKIIVDVAPIGNKTPGVIGRKSSTYKNIIVNVYTGDLEIKVFGYRSQSRKKSNCAYQSSA